ncbi:hypothetical protein TcasGA2_TC033139 [Tribolium castaneum]|uniref:Uncharacterized protein n=1 Tax=Tribolium castaneum TaxID=7070 RepID=A0A139WHD9_TRICA|nr:hypothetical protein TcasGA2_TC033139 [Tribolium castaneum]
MKKSSALATSGPQVGAFFFSGVRFTCVSLSGGNGLGKERTPCRHLCDGSAILETAVRKQEDVLEFMLQFRKK